MRNKNYIDTTTITIDEENEILYNRTIEGARVYTVTASTHGGETYSTEVVGYNTLNEVASYGLYLISILNKVRIKKDFKKVIDLKYPIKKT